MAKYRDDSEREHYLFDCLWAMATDMRFTASDAPESTPEYKTWPTLRRWKEKPKPQEVEQKPPNKDDIKARLVQLKEEVAHYRTI